MKMIENPYAWIEQDLEVLRRAQWYRIPTLLPGKILQMGSNNYLGLAKDRRLQQAATCAIKAWGTGSTGSRLLSGNLAIHQSLEKAIAALKGTEAALVFSSGYLANLGTIGALVGKRDLVLADALNHACLRQGALLSGAKVLSYRHCDLEDLTAQLSQHRSQFRRCLIVTDSVFSMEGDIAPLSLIVELANTYNAMVLVDEAHGTGVFGAGGGVVQMLGITTPIVQVGTLSKALGSQGGFVAGSHQLIDYLRNRAGTWIYTTGLSPGDAGAALAAIHIVRSEPERRMQLWQNLRSLEQGLATLSLSLPPITTPIVPLHLGNIQETLRIAKLLREQDIFVPAIRPPTVSTARLRVSLMSTHTQADIDRFLATLQKILSSR